jgi:hypothetical protein
MKRCFRSLAVTACGLAYLATGLPVYADENISLEPPAQFEKLKNISVASMVSAAIRLILIVAALLFFFMLILGGIKWILSGGDKAGVEGAQKQITAALIGLGIVFLTWVIIALVKMLFGVDILQLSIPSFQR